MKLVNCPRIVIESVERLEIPRYIGEGIAEVIFAEKRVPGMRKSQAEVLPANIRRKFREKGESSVRYRGLVYSIQEGQLTQRYGIKEYLCSKDVTAKATELMDACGIHEYLDWLRESRGIQLDTLELFEQLGNRRNNFAFVDRQRNSRVYGRFGLQFQGDYTSSMSGIGPMRPRIIVQLAEVKYRRLRR